MEKLFGQNDSKVISYVEEVFHPEDSILKEIRERSSQNGLPEIQVGTMDGLHLEVLTRGIGAKKVVEIGTLGGYSGVCICRGLPRDGILFTFEMNPNHIEVARKSFSRAGFFDQVRIIEGSAIETLSKIESEGPFDLVFMDADKISYPFYLDWAAKNLRVGGVVLADNTFAWGMISNQEFENIEDKTAVTALRQFNHQAANGGRFRATALPTGEGLTMAVKIR